MEPEEPVHRLARRRPDRAGHRAKPRRPAASSPSAASSSTSPSPRRCRAPRRPASIILDAVGQSDLETIRDQALNERDYGDLSGLNKDDARAKWGEEQVHIWRRSYDIPPPGGESLKDTGARVWPYYLHDMQPHVLRGEHGAGRRARQFAARADHGARRHVAARRSSSSSSAPACRSIYRLNADSTVASKEILEG